MITLSAPPSFEGLEAGPEVLAEVTAAKLFIAGNEDTAAAAGRGRLLRADACSPSVPVILTTGDHGTDILTGNQAGIVSTEMINWLERYLPVSGGVGMTPSDRLPDRLRAERRVRGHLPRRHGEDRAGLARHRHHALRPAPGRAAGSRRARPSRPVHAGGRGLRRGRRSRASGRIGARWRRPRARRSSSVPDNGVLSLAWEALGGVEAAVEIENPAVVLAPVSRTFHGRDVFAPAAAHLAAGMTARATSAPPCDAGTPGASGRAGPDGGGREPWAPGSRRPTASGTCS